MDQIGTMYKISEILGKAFKEVNDVCAHYLADQSVQNGTKQAKIVEKKAVQEKPQVTPKVETQPKKVQVSLQKTKPKAPVQEIVPNPKPATESKPKQQHKQQSQTQQSNKKAQPHPDKPKQPLSAFFLFQQEQKENLQKMHPTASITDLTKMMGEIWRGLDDDEKSPFVEKAKVLKTQYEKKLQKFYEKHPEEKSKKQLKKEKQEAKGHAEESSSPVQKPQASSKPKKTIVIEEESNSESV